MSKPLPRFASVRSTERFEFDFIGEADQVVHRRQRGVEFLEMLRQRALRIDVKRRAEFFGQRFDGHAFAKQLVSDVMKIVH